MKEIKDTRKRLERCWNLDVSWKHYPTSLKEVCDFTELSDQP